MSIRLQGYFTEYIDSKAKLMFLDDYDSLNSLSFTKSYLTNKSEKIRGKAPINGDYFTVNCGKICFGYIPDCDKTNLSVKIAPIEELRQHKVECVVELKKYNFKKNNNQIEGWNLKLISMTLLEH